MGDDLSASIGDIRDRDFQSSPIKRSATATGQRPRPNSGDELAGDTGMGAKQMEKTMSTLHKQNFDLKVELYHRRNRQTALEEKVEKLESERSEMMDIQESLLAELETRDKAIGEAVNMIVKLEGQVSELVWERDAQQIEADGSYHHSHPDQDQSEHLTAALRKASDMSRLHLPEDVKGLERMPSFLTERTEQTENLRNVVLGGRDSQMHLRKISESSADPSEINRIASPSLSVLSTSSFTSIYGAKDGQDKTDSPSLDNVVGMDGSQMDRSSTPTQFATTENWRNQNKVVPGRMSTGTSKGPARLSTQMQSLNNVLGPSPPLQKMEKLDKQINIADDVSRSSTSSQSRSTAPSRSMKPQQQAKTKHEKREALEKVLTNYPKHKEPTNLHTLPPTPDTVSSSILRRHENHTSSDDSLTKQARGVPGENSLAASDRSGRSANLTSIASPALDSQPIPAAAFPNRKHIPVPSIDTNFFSDLSRLAYSLPPRPRSAAETTSSHARADSFVSDSDSDGGVDAYSEVDSFDHWMQESMKPDRRYVASSGRRRNDRSTSPDLFSFPADSGSWESDAIFGALQGNGFLGSPVSALKRDPIDEMTQSLQMSQGETLDPPANGNAPPTPDRRSSLHARTGSSSVVPSLGGLLKKSPARDTSTNRAGGRFRSNSVDVAAQGSSSRVQRPEGAGMATRRNHYPPISGQSSRGRGLGLNSLFKRPGSESNSVASTTTEGVFPVPAAAQLPPPTQPLSPVKSSGRNSVPPPATMPWILRPPGVLEDELNRATPPPIMRNRAPPPAPLSVAGSEGIRIASPVDPQKQDIEMVGPNTPTTAVGPSGGGSGNTTPGTGQNVGKRKWLGLGRMGSLMNRAG
ncbi:hypothetical protein F4779DRAFT_616975 [Xylariaceae sp. FL0662B]|nr:hypothetical protein F4779DRAFT_616975 [Xylariaceae sp. FL0662B]